MMTRSYKGLLLRGCVAVVLRGAGVFMGLGGSHESRRLEGWQDLMMKMMMIRSLAWHN